MNYTTRKLTMTAALSALAGVLMFLQFSVPLMPGFIKLDFSELPALIASFAIGPLSGAAVCLIKNLLHLPMSNTMFVGEISNFILGLCFVIPAGLVYKYMKNRKGAVIGSVLGALLMAAASLPSNYYIIYPIYAQIMPMDAIIGAYNAINPNIHNLWQALIVFNFPFTFIKGLLSVIITVPIYKKISPLIKGTK